MIRTLVKSRCCLHTWSSFLVVVVARASGMWFAVVVPYYSLFGWVPFIHGSRMPGVVWGGG